MEFIGEKICEKINVGKVKIYKKNVEISEKKFIDIECVDENISKFKNLIKKYTDRLKEADIRNNLEKDIIKVYIEMVTDPYFEETVIDKISHKMLSYKFAVKDILKEMEDDFSKMDNSYFRERASDYSNIVREILYLEDSDRLDEVTLYPNTILIAEDLAPYEIVSLNLNDIRGFIFKRGTYNSHISIIARNLGIPTLVNVCDNFFDIVKEEDIIIIDGVEGKIHLNPSDEKCKSYEILIEEEKLKELENIKNNSNDEIEAVTKDGIKISVNANISDKRDLNEAIKFNCDGVGLLRTEFFFMKYKDFPGLKTQKNFYEEIIRDLNGKSLVLRTLDIGEDKSLPYFTSKSKAFGYRGIKLYKEIENQIITQIEAVLMCFVYGVVKIIVPMVSDINEIFYVRALIDKAKDNLKAKGISYSDDVEFGIMIETPASLIIIDDFYKYIDFVSIGTNDLMQYLVVMDRNYGRGFTKSDFYNPSLIRSLIKIIESAKRNGKKASICENIASDLAVLPLIIGMGFTEISVSPNLVGKIKNKIRSLSFERCVTLLEKIKPLFDVEKIKEELIRFNS